VVVRIAGNRMYLWRAVDHEARFSTCSFSVGETRRRHSG
jgi:transposase-like protein